MHLVLEPARTAPPTGRRSRRARSPSAIAHRIPRTVQLQRRASPRRRGQRPRHEHHQRRPGRCRAPAWAAHRPGRRTRFVLEVDPCQRDSTVDEALAVLERQPAVARWWPHRRGSRANGAHERRHSRRVRDPRDHLVTARSIGLEDDVGGPAGPGGVGTAAPEAVTTPRRSPSTAVQAAGPAGGGAQHPAQATATRPPWSACPARATSRCPGPRLVMTGSASSGTKQRRRRRGSTRGCGCGGSCARSPRGGERRDLELRQRIDLPVTAARSTPSASTKCSAFASQRGHRAPQSPTDDAAELDAAWTASSSWSPFARAAASQDSAKRTSSRHRLDLDRQHAALGRRDLAARSPIPTDGTDSPTSTCSPRSRAAPSSPVTARSNRPGHPDPPSHQIERRHSVTLRRRYPERREHPRCGRHASAGAPVPPGLGCQMLRKAGCGSRANSSSAGR